MPLKLETQEDGILARNGTLCVNARDMLRSVQDGDELDAKAEHKEESFDAEGLAF